MASVIEILKNLFACIGGTHFRFSDNMLFAVTTAGYWTVSCKVGMFMVDMMPMVVVGDVSVVVLGQLIADVLVQVVLCWV